jgi:hypothetical protein
MRDALDTFGTEGSFDDELWGGAEQHYPAGRTEMFPALRSSAGQHMQSQRVTHMQPGPTQSQKDTSMKQSASCKSIPKVPPQSSAVLKAQRRQKEHRQQQAKQQLIDFLKNKSVSRLPLTTVGVDLLIDRIICIDRSPAEAGLEKAIADIFEEVRLRKVHAAKRGSVK